MGAARDKMPSGAGVCVWLTGHGGAGKSTVARELAKVIEDRGRTVTILDVVPELEKAPGERTSSGKLRRKAFVAARVADHGGVAICVTISSRRQDREMAREVVGDERFVEIYVDAPPDVAQHRREGRNRKMRPVKRARRAGRKLARQLGLARGLGFEVPEDPDLTLDPVSLSPEDEARLVCELLERRGFLSTVTGVGEGSGDVGENGRST